MEFTSNQGSHFVLTFAGKWIRQKIVVESGSRKLPGDPHTPTMRDDSVAAVPPEFLGNKPNTSGDLSWRKRKIP